MVLDTSLLNTQPYKVRFKWSNPGKGVAPSPTVVAIEMGAFRQSLTTVANFTYFMSLQGYNHYGSEWAWE